MILWPAYSYNSTYDDWVCDDDGCRLTHVALHCHNAMQLSTHCLLMLHCAAPGGLDSYVVQPSKGASAAVLLVTDIFGYKTEGIRRWADKLADAVSTRAF